MKINFSAMTDEERTSAFAAMDNDALSAALTEARSEGKVLFALKGDDLTIEKVNEAEAVAASVKHIEAEQATRAAAVKDAAKRFAAAQKSFAINEGVDSSDDEGDDDDDDEDGDSDEDGDEDDDDDDSDEDDESDEDASTVEAAASDDESDEDDESADDKKKKKKQPPFEKAGSASGVNHTTRQRVKTSAASKVGRRTKRPAVAAKAPITITASADIPNVPMGSRLDSMEEVTSALLSRVKGFPSFNLGAAKAMNSQSGGQAVINKAGVASFGMGTPEALVSSGASDDYAAIRRAVKGRYATPDETLTAAGWCAPSETVYTYIADYVVDGLSPTPEIAAPRGGINITTGPERSSQGEALDDFGWTQTEAQAEARQAKPFEVIDCPEFEDFRLDAVGYAYKIPLLTQHAYPEIVTDALRFANVLYAHRVNRRVIMDKVDLSTEVEFNGYGSSFTDSLEAVSILATRERRKWNLGENAVMEVEAPVIAREVYRADMSRRTGLALSDVATDQKIAAEFSARHINVTYVSDWQEVPDGDLALPGDFQIMVYPAGTFARANEDVVNLSAIYDAASLSVNEYTGVFFEQGYLLVKVGYGSSLLTIPVNTAGQSGAANLTGFGDGHANGSF